MATYTISDIHGCYDNFIKMLIKINFSNDDLLILLGDYIDRGDKSYEMLKWLENKPKNVITIKGNHDVKFVEYIDILLSYCYEDFDYESNDELLEIYNRVDEEYFDEYATIKNMLLSNKICMNNLLNWKNIINDMLYFYKTSINNRNYVFVHAGYIDDDNFEYVSEDYEDIESYYVYAWDEALEYTGLNNSTIVFGHTPTIANDEYFNSGNIFRCTDENDNVFINVDCGSSYVDNKDSKLACLNIETDKEYYI